MAELPLPAGLSASTFPAKLWRLANSPRVRSVRWDSRAQGLLIDRSLFERELLSPGNAHGGGGEGVEPVPDSFQATHFGSFVRQLNLYGFYRVRGWVGSDEPADAGGWLHFRNPNFRRDRPDLLLRIKRLTRANRQRLAAGLEVRSRQPSRFQQLHNTAAVPSPAGQASPPALQPPPAPAAAPPSPAAPVQEAEAETSDHQPEPSPEPPVALPLPAAQPPAVSQNSLPSFSGCPETAPADAPAPVPVPLPCHLSATIGRGCPTALSPSSSSGSPSLQRHRPLSPLSLTVLQQLLRGQCLGPASSLPALPRAVCCKPPHKAHISGWESHHPQPSAHTTQHE
ncbi:unnamed protein product, partial [Coccothraustes coccothraustes]